MELGYEYMSLNNIWKDHAATAYKSHAGDTKSVRIQDAVSPR